MKKQAKQLLRRATVIAACLLLCSCSELQLGVDELISAPRLTEDQSAIYDAIEMAVGTDSFKLKYPRRGDYLSACAMADLDHDGQDEAVVFYELTVGSSTSTWLGVLAQQADGVWKSRYQLPGEGGEVDFVNFAPVEQAGASNIIVGWSVAGQEANLCKVYSYADGSITVGYEGGYSEVLIADVDQNGLSELVLCTKNFNRQATMSLIKYRAGRIVRTSEVPMPSAMTDYARLTYGKLTEGLYAVFADIYLGDDEVTTRIAAIDTKKSIIEELASEELGIYASFDRAAPTLYCDDVNGDGLIDIPLSYPLPGYSSADETEAIYYTEYLSVIDGELGTVQRSIENFSAGYRLRLPESWRGGVTVKRQPDTGEWRFVIYGESLEQSDAELLRIKVVAPSDYQDKFETAQYETIATKGVNRYMVHIPEQRYPGYSVTLEQVRQLFSLIHT